MHKSSKKGDINAKIILTIYIDDIRNDEADIITATLKIKEKLLIEIKNVICKPRELIKEHSYICTVENLINVYVEMNTTSDCTS